LSSFTDGCDDGFGCFGVEVEDSYREALVSEASSHRFADSPRSACHNGDWFILVHFRKFLIFDCLIN
jgi:hypothetical protein